MGKNEAILLGNPNVALQTTTTLNLTTLHTPGLREGGSDLQHDCLEIIDQIYSSRPAANRT